MSKPIAPPLNPNILIINDNAEETLILESILGSTYPSVIVMDTGPALDPAPAAAPKLIIISASLKDTCPFELAARLKSAPATRETPILFTLKSNDATLVMRCFASGAVDCLAAPFEEKVVMARVQAHLSLQELKQQLQMERAERKLVEEELRRSEAQFRTIYEHEPECVKILNPDCTLIAMNPAGLAMIEAESLDMVKGQSVLPIVDEAFRDDFQKLTERVCRDGESGQLTFKITGLKGTPCWLDTHAVPLRDSRGSIIGLLGVTRDITEYKRMELAMKSSEEKYKLLFDAAGDAIFIHDENGKMLNVNRQSLERMGYTFAEIMDMHISQVDAPEERHMAPQRIETLMRQGYHTFETVHQRKDGSKIPTEVSARRIEWDGIPAMMSICRDITARKKAERSLLQRNKEMAILYETALEINTLSDLPALLNIIIRHACELSNIPSGAIFLSNPKTSLLTLVAGHGIPAEMSGMELGYDEGLVGQAFRTKQPFAVENYQTWDGKLKNIPHRQGRRGLGVPLKVHDNVIGVIVLMDQQTGTYSDEEIQLASLFAGQAAIAISNAQFATELENRVTERTQALELAIKELESISYTVSHNLRSPLRGIFGYSHLIKNDYPEALNPKVVDLLDQIMNNAAEMGNMIDGLLKFIRYNHLALSVKEVDHNELITKAIRELKSLIAQRPVEFSVQTIPPSQGDAEMLYEVWFNLLSNAIKFSHPHPSARIEIGCHLQEAGEPVYYVRDDGIGFDMQYVGDIFKVFHRLHHEAGFEGIGLGLALSQRIITRHGGRIWAEAQVEGGATFYFTLQLQP